MTTAYPVDTREGFKAWAVHKPNAAKLLREIIFRWRGSSARLPEHAEKWTVYPWEAWCGWANLSRKQLKTALAELDAQGLILRVRHPFGGRTFHAYLTPTLAAVKHAGKKEDVARYEESLRPPLKPKKSGGQGPTLGPTSGPMMGPMLGPTDHTTSSTLPTSSTAPNSGDAVPGIASEIPAVQEGTGEVAPEKKNPPAPLAPSLPVIWAKAITDTYPGEFPALTPMHRKMLKDFAAKCPPGYAGNVLDHAVRHWTEFANTAASAAGAFKTPPKAAVPFLLKFMGVAVNLWMDAHGLVWTGEALKVEYVPPPTKKLIVIPKKTISKKSTTPNEVQPKTWAELMKQTDPD